MKELDRNLYKQYECVLMTNFDHTIELNAEEILKSNKTYSGYPAWDFHGDVWFEEGKFYCEIWQYRSHIDTIEADSLQEIMNIASNRYGYY